ncbi:DUF6166 domain-containing protein [Sulfuricurvum sp.]|uniref:DUF6166 domain-containing protein n=1 Tax=Sulfuricurvum sp. TaxID=2025608 RepID=UPI003BAE2656
MSNKIYKGIKTNEIKPTVTCNGELLDPHYEIEGKSWPGTFEWGYGGGGPRRLAIAILFDATGNENTAINYAQPFVEDVISKLGNEWELSDFDVMLWHDNRTMNIVKRVCKELGITQKELGDMLDVQQSTLSGWATNKIPKMAQLALELLLENKSLKSDIEIIKKAHEILHR